MPSKAFEVSYTTNIPQKVRGVLGFGPVKREVIAYGAKEGAETAEKESKGRYGKKGFHLLTTFEQNGLIARVQPRAQARGIAWVVETGRKPGKAPPLRALKGWASNFMDVSDKGALRALQQRIREGGTRGVGYFAKGEQAADRAIKSGTPKAEREIERDFNA